MIFFWKHHLIRIWQKHSVNPYLDWICIEQNSDKMIFFLNNHTNRICLVWYSLRKNHLNQIQKYHLIRWNCPIGTEKNIILTGISYYPKYHLIRTFSRNNNRGKEGENRDRQKISYYPDYHLKQGSSYPDSTVYIRYSPFYQSKS